MGFGISGELTGLKDVLKALESVKASVARRLLRTGLNTASTPMAKTAKRLAPKYHGTLRKSIGKIVKTYPNTGAVVVVIGPRKGFKREVAVKKDKVFRHVRGRILKIANPAPELLTDLVDPIYYAHIVELGSIYHAPTPFLRPAFDLHKDQLMRNLAEHVRKGIEKAAKK